MRYSKKIIIFICIFCLLILGNCSFAIVPKTSEFYVNDSANLLDDDTEKYIINMNKALEEKTGAQIVVVTVQNLEGKSIEDYATELFRNYGIGNKDKNNGVLLLCAYEEREFRIEVGYGLEGILTDGKTGRIQDNYIIPYLKQNNFNEGIKNGFNAVLQEVENEYGISIDGAQKGNVVETDANKNTVTNFIPHLIMFILFILIMFFSATNAFFFIGGIGPGRGGFGGGSFGGGSFGGGGASGGGGSSRGF